MPRMRFMNEEVEPPKITKNILVRILKYFIPYTKQMIVAVLAILISAILGVIPPILIKNIVDIALPQKSLKLLVIFIVTSISITVISGLVQVGQTYLNTWIAKHIIFNMKNQMYDHLEHMSLSFFSTTNPGEIITRMNSDIDGIQDIFNTTVVNAFSSIFVLASAAVVLVSMNWKLAILGMFILPLFVSPMRKVGKLRWRIATESQEKISELNQIVQETLGISGTILMKIFTKEKDEYKNFEKVNKEVINLQIKESLAGRWFMMTISIFTTIGPMLIYFYGGYLFIHGDITIGGIVAFVAILGRLYGPVIQLSNIHIDITRSFALFGRIFDYFDKKQEIINMPNAEVMHEVKGLIEFASVNFSYNGIKDTLKDINFTVMPGEMSALVGPSGSGKTTITNLIPRLYEVGSGKIKIDGIDIKSVTLESLRAQIGIVMQEPYLFNASIKDNLLYAKKEATDEEVINACKASYIHDFIMTLPEGYNTIVGNRGIKLSGGEKQRVSIARVILKDPRIIILDEATSSLDSVSEEYIQKAMIPLLKGRTSLVIAHRLSTVLAADKIIVMQDGDIVEMGKHEDLLKEDGLYRDLYDTQFKSQK